VKSPAPRVTVVIPSYNAEDTIRRALDSAFAQSPYVDEVLVIDDGSDDSTVEIVREYRPSVTLLVEPHRGDPAVPRNIGVERASNELIAFLDADDVWLPGKVGAQIAALGSDSSAGLVCTNAFRQTQPGVFHDLAPLLPDGMGASGGVLPILLANNFVITSSVLVLRGSLEEAGPFDSGLAAAEDYGVWLRAAAVCRFVYLEQPWLTYRDYGGSYRGEWSQAETASAILSNLDRLEQRFPGTARRYAKEFGKRRSELFGIIGRQALANGDRRGALQSFSAAVRQRPSRLSSWKRLLGALAPSGARSGRGR